MSFFWAKPCANWSEANKCLWQNRCCTTGTVFYLWNNFVSTLRLRVFQNFQRKAARYTIHYFRQKTPCERWFCSLGDSSFIRTGAKASGNRRVSEKWRSFSIAALLDEYGKEQSVQVVFVLGLFVGRTFQLIKTCGFIDWGSSTSASWSGFTNFG